MRKLKHLIKMEINSCKKVIYRNKNSDIISIENLENNYQVKFNKYILGIFKTKSKTFKFIEKWIKRHSNLCFSPVSAS
jgi:hypothetical protein